MSFTVFWWLNIYLYQLSFDWNNTIRYHKSSVFTISWWISKYIYVIWWYNWKPYLIVYLPLFIQLPPAHQLCPSPSSSLTSSHLLHFLHFQKPHSLLCLVSNHSLSHICMRYLGRFCLWRFTCGVQCIFISIERCYFVTWSLRGQKGGEKGCVTICRPRWSQGGQSNMGWDVSIIG